MLSILTGALSLSAAYVQPAAPCTVVSRSSPSCSPQMLVDGPMSRRAALASVLAAGVPLSASAMIVPGLNGPGLVPAKPKATAPKPDFDSDIRDADTNHFWSPKGIMDSVPKVNGIITPKPAGFKTK